MFESINLIKMTTGKSQERIFFYTSKYMQTFILFLGVTYSVVEEYVDTRLYPVVTLRAEITFRKRNIGHTAKFRLFNASSVTLT